eukprot:9333284-Pyramimonas_sp.AAC.1
MSSLDIPTTRSARGGGFFHQGGHLDQSARADGRDAQEVWPERVHPLGAGPTIEPPTGLSDRAPNDLQDQPPTDALDQPLTDQSDELPTDQSTQRLTDRPAKQQEAACRESESFDAIPVPA